MKTFINDNFLLYNNVAEELYHDIAKNLPIIDYHNHLSPEEIFEDKKFNTITEAWLDHDHYKWRAMRANGINEEFITGNSSDFDKFHAWSKTVPKMLGNPLYHWTHLELLRYFDIDILLNEGSANEIWTEVNNQLSKPNKSARSLLDEQQVKFVGTTDDPVDSLNHHSALLKEDYDVFVSPSFRADNALDIEKDSFIDWLASLEKATDMEIKGYTDFIQALEKRIDYFDQMGCKSADCGIGKMFYERTNKDEVEIILNKRLNHMSLTNVEINKFKTYTFLTLGELYAGKKWINQMHIGALRDTNTKMFNRLGNNSGYDSINDDQMAYELSNVLNELDKKDKLPKTVLYSLNQKDYYVLATMAGNFQSDEIAGKVQFGTSWWFNDQIDGMEYQMKVLANIGLISNFIGMLTDSRSILSFPRHEYFRRILCNILGDWVTQGKAPYDMELLKEYVQGISYYNIKKYLNI